VKQSFNMRILCKILALLFRHVGNVDLAITSIYRKPRTPLKEQDISVPSGLSKILATHVLFSEGYRYSAITVTSAHSVPTTDLAPLLLDAEMISILPCCLSKACFLWAPRSCC
jgi:hypothetical protein